jgi:methionine-rich copper-binding protein CopC
MRSLRGLLLVLFLVSSVVLFPASAQAHARLVSTNPADGAVLTTMLDSVTFTFNENILEGSTAIAFVDEIGSVIDSSPGTLMGPSITAAWPRQASQGSIQVSYRVVSADGHPVMGSITVTLAGTSSSKPDTTIPAPLPEAIQSANSGFPLPISLAIAITVMIALGAVFLRITSQRRRHGSS